MRVPGPDRATTAPRLAVYPEEKTSADSAPMKVASSCSSSSCSTQPGSFPLPLDLTQPGER
ncbi:Uncharacterised protein [Mycobacteroides abscessus subsp. abscessus]|nr:Uncharacterised protein [Mycobacteroides abscessus subsp. abscessus]